MIPPPLGTERPESASSMSSDIVNTNVPGARGAPMELSIVGPSSADGVRWTERPQSVSSPTERSAAPFGQQPSFLLAVDKMMADWERGIAEVGGQLPTTEGAATTFEQALVWPSSDSATPAGGTTGAGDEDQVYGGGQIIGLNGDVILSAGPLGEHGCRKLAPAPSSYTCCSAAFVNALWKRTIIPGFPFYGLEAPFRCVGGLEWGMSRQIYLRSAWSLRRVCAASVVPASRGRIPNHCRECTL